jgi:hypothetical protein
MSFQNGHIGPSDVLANPVCEIVADPVLGILW